MNIYTLHKAGSFRPPTLESAREKLPRPYLGALADEKKVNSSNNHTSVARASEHSSSSGEKTTPRNNGSVHRNNNGSVQEAFTKKIANNVTQNVRVSASRIDASGVITETNAPLVAESKQPVNIQHVMRPKKNRAAAYSSSKMMKNRQMNLIHIQAKDEFMVFVDNTDCVSHMTTPSAIRTSPLETDYLIIDHEEFEEELSLFSAITVPKVFRRKRTKKMSTSKNRDDTSSRELKSKSGANSSMDEDEVTLALMTSYEETEDEQEQRELREPPSSPPRLVRNDNIDNIKIPRCSSHSQCPSESGEMSKGSDLRGGKRGTTSSDRDEKAPTPKKISEEKYLSSQDRSTVSIASSRRKEVESEEKQEYSEDERKSDSKQEQKKKSPDKKSLKAPTCYPQVQKVKIAESTQGQKVKTTESSPKKTRVKQESDESTELDGVKKYTNFSKKDASTDGITFAAAAAIYSLDMTAKTIMDSTARASSEGSNNDGSTHGESNNRVGEGRKIPNSRKHQKQGISFAWCLPTSYFCNHRRRKQQLEEIGMTTTDES